MKKAVEVFRTALKTNTTSTGDGKGRA
jgi:hypothetical protein